MGADSILGCAVEHETRDVLQVTLGPAGATQRRQASTVERTLSVLAVAASRRR
jgi:hypothetical protein